MPTTGWSEKVLLGALIPNLSHSSRPPPQRKWLNLGQETVSLSLTLRCDATLGTVPKCWPHTLEWTGPSGRSRGKQLSP